MAKGNKKVLLIDDDGDFAASTRAFLQGRGYEVDTAANGTEGWQKIQTGAPDLIVLDIMMDYDAEGFNLAYKLRQDDTMGKTPIIIVSGFSQHLSEKMTDFEFVLGQDWPADAYFEKPIQLKELVKSIDRIISNSDGRVAAEGTH
jgi:DNA-binding response OmpR family regulator